MAKHKSGTSEKSRHGKAERKENRNKAASAVPGEPDVLGEPVAAPPVADAQYR
jgi:hypothetical protein